MYKYRSPKQMARVKHPRRCGVHDADAKKSSTGTYPQCKLKAGHTGTHITARGKAFR